MPAKSGPLGFNCPDCGLDYGSTYVVDQSNRKRGREVKSDLNIQEISHRRRSKLHPVEYAWKNKIISQYQREDFLKAVNTLIELQNSSWWKTLPSRKQRELDERFNNAITIAQTKLENRIKEFKEEDKKDALWDIVEEENEIEEPKIYELTKLMGHNVIEKLDEESEGKEKRKIKTIKWNPVMEIKAYRESIDPFLYGSNEPLELYTNAVKNHSSHMKETLPAELEPLINKGIEVYHRYQEQFYNPSWRYKWYEWFWIARYADATSPRRAVKMLLALDGEEEGRMLHKYIKRRIKPVLKFWQEFFEYIRYFLLYRSIIISCVIKNNQELSEQYEKILEEKKIDREDYKKEMIEQQYLESRQEEQDQQFKNSDVVDIAAKKMIMDNGIIKVGTERIYICHSNPNYKKEMEEFNKELRKERPNKQALHGPFHPYELPSHIVEQLRQEGKLELF